MRSGQILWPTDFSETAAHALRYAIEMANLYHVLKNPLMIYK